MINSKKKIIIIKTNFVNNFYFLCKIGSGKAAKEQLAAVEKYLGTGNGGGSADPMTVELFRPLP